MVQANGSPVTGNVNIRAELAYTGPSSGTTLCTQDILGVALTNGVFHVKLNLDCTASGTLPTRTLTKVLAQIPANESVAIRITDLSHSKQYSYQALHSLPYANVASQLEQMNANPDDVLTWDNNEKQWKPKPVSASSGGTVTNVSVSAPLAISNPASTPSITLPQANGSQNGYLSSADWNTFNSKQGALPAGGTSAHYYRGDNSWQTLNTSVVPENVANLYFTNARALEVPLTGFTTATGAIVATDKTLEAFGKAQGQINSLVTDSSKYLIKNNTDSITGLVNVGTTGLLQLAYTPVGMNDATNKSYVDSEMGAKVNKTGDTMSGVLTLDDDLKIKGGSNYVTLKGHATAAAYNLVLPSNAGTIGQFLQTDGSGNLSWVAQSSSATPSGAAGGDLSGTYPNPTVPGLANKISTTLASGNILVGNGSNVASAVLVSGDATLSNTGVLTLSNTVSAGTYNSVTVDSKGRVTGGSNPSIVNSVAVAAPITISGTATSPIIGMPAATTSVDGYLSSADFTTFNNKQAAITSASTINTGSLTSHLQGGLNLNPYNTGTGDTGEIRFYELTANGSNYTGFKSPDVLGANVIYTLPSADGSSGQVLTTNSSGVLSWSTPATTAAPIGSAGGDLAGSYPNPTIKTGLDAAKLSTGAVTNTEFDYLDGVTSAIQAQLDGKQLTDATLTSLASFNTNGFLVQTAADTFLGRSIVGTANRVSVTNGDGVSGNPTINVDSDLLPSPAGGGQWLKSTGANTSAWTTLGSSDITTALGFTPINKASDTVSSGLFNFNGAAVIRTLDPVGPTDVVTKQYVDGFGQWIKNATDLYFATGSVGIGATSVNSSAIFEMTSTTKGFLPPRMTTVQRNAIATPVSGLTIYNTTTQFYEYYNGSTWNIMGGGVPNGTISAFESTTCPVGWVEYTAARGQFLRGIDNGAGIDPSGTRAPGNPQTDSNKSHAHTASSAADGAHNHTGTTTTNGNHAHSVYAFYPADAQALIVNDSGTDKLLGTDNQGGPGFFSSNQATNAGGDHNHTFTTSTSATHNHAITVNNDGGTETRPKNIAVLYCKYVGGTPSYTPPNVEGLANVNVSAPANGQALVYDSGSSKWINQTIGSALGFNPVNKAGDTMTGSLTVNGNVSSSGDLNTGAGQGFKIRRGTATCTINLAVQTGTGAVCPVNFGYTFASAPIVTATNSNPGNWRDGVIVNTIGKSTTGFSLYFFNAANNVATGDMIIDWIAIGQ